MAFDKKYYLDVKEKLDAVSPSFCLAKWLKVTLHLHIGHTHSCYHCTPHEVPKDLLKKDPSVLHNTPFKAERRKEMLEGKRPGECDFCWKAEDLGGISDRFNISSSPWMSEAASTIDLKDHQQKIAPTYVEVSFSNTCNFKCSYCSPSASSRWYKEVKEQGPYQVRDLAYTYLPPQFDEEENPYIEAWWKWLPEIYPGLRVLRLTGGEPLLSENTFKLMDYFLKNENSRLGFAVNTNLGVPAQVMDRFIQKAKVVIEEKKLQDFTVFTSLDTWGEQAEYIRNGLSLSLFQRNLDALLTECPEMKLSFMITFQSLSLPNFNQLLEYILDLKKRFNHGKQNRIHYSIDKLLKPSHQSILTLPAEFNPMMEKILDFMKKRVGESKFDLDPRQLDRFETVYAWMRQNQEHATVELDRKDFVTFFKRHDALRGTNFLKTFPEFESFWENCKAY